MKKGCLLGGGLLGILVIFGILLAVWSVGINNELVGLDENVSKSWSNVQNTYQKRTDLIPNLVNTVKGAADFEKSTLTEVIEARSKATQTTIDPSNLTAEKIQEFQAAQGGVSSALSRLLVTVERYPELKANQNFLSLQTELSSIENEILFERQKFNEEASTFNKYAKTIPNKWIADFYGFEERPYFEADKGSENAPSVEF